MSDTVIKVENLFKEYRLGTVSHGTLRHDLASWWAKARGKDDPNSLLTTAPSAPAGHLPALRGEGKKDEEELKQHFLALNDISFEVKAGEALGIIGRNGAGKSTLLKVLSRITAPSAGTIKVKGKMSSLLEVGTGFHPEMTGRENVYMNGAILGMRRWEIGRKMDEIIAFAELEKFIDTPVKRYSSGMYVRLAFAVAAHLDSEILVLDEVLAVGDAAFQKKCLGKMDDVAHKQGRTVLFVSHQMNAIESFCNRIVVLKQGCKIIDTPDVHDGINRYIGVNETDGSEWKNEPRKAKYENNWFVPLRISVTDKNGKNITMPIRNDQDDVYITIEGDLREEDAALSIGYALFNENNHLMYWSYNTDKDEKEWPKLKKGHYILRSKFPKHLLNEGNYRIELSSSLHFRQWLCEPGVNSPSIALSISGGLSDSPYWIMKRPGAIAPIIQWYSYDK